MTGLLVVWLVGAPVPAVELGPAGLAVVVNAADASSVEIGDYYEARGSCRPGARV